MKQTKSGDTDATEGIFGEARNAVWNEQTNTPNNVWTGGTDALIGASTREIGKWWGKTMNVTVNPDDTILRGKMQMNFAATPVQNLSAATSGLRYQVKTDDGRTQWLTAESYKKEMEGKFKDNIEVYREAYQAYLKSVEEGGNDPQFETTAFRDLSLEDRGHLITLLQLENNPQGMVMNVRATEGYLEAQYTDEDGVLRPVEKSAVQNDAPWIDQAKPYASLTYAQYQDGKINPYLPLINVVYDITTEAGSQLDGIYSGMNTQQHRDDKGQGGDRGTQYTPNQQFTEALFNFE